jgi:hypothetical protein
LNGEANSASKKHNSETMIADVRRFCHQIIRTTFSVHTGSPAYTITALTEHQAQVAEQERQLREILDFCPAGLNIVDEEGRLLSVSDSWRIAPSVRSRGECHRYRIGQH